MGDIFINKIFYALPEANQNKYKSDKVQLYLYDYYNVQCFVSNPLTKLKELPARVVNSLIHALNDNSDEEDKKSDIKEKKFAPFLPRFILIVPDWDIVKHIGHYQYGVSIITEKLLKWIIMQMERAIAVRKEDLARTKAGATLPNDPKMIWVAMVDRVGCFDCALSVRNKFNSVLETILADHKHHYIIDINRQLNDSTYFSANTFNNEGAMRYLLEINQKIRDFDAAQGDSLKPLKPTDRKPDRYRMPPPPPPPLGDRNRAGQDSR